MEDGRAVATDYITRLFGRKVIEAGLPVITLHGLRHVSATMLLRAGEPIRVVSQRTGHATPDITLAVYAHVLPGDGLPGGAARGCFTRPRLGFARRSDAFQGRFLLALLVV